MRQKILIAFDDSENAMRAVQYIADSLSTDNRITLLHIVPDTAALCQMNSPELTSYFLSQQTTFCALEDRKMELVKDSMEKAKSLLLKADFSEKDIICKVERKNKGVARDIVNEASLGYDLIVLGRRGISGIQEFFFGSVSQKVLNAVKDISVLIVN